MVAETEQSPSSTWARQGSVTSNLESPSSSAAAAAASHSAQRERLAAFLQDQAFDVGSGNSDDVGSHQTQRAREQRLKGLVASVDAHFQNVGAGNTSNNTSDGAGNNGSSSNDADTQIRQQPHGQYHARKTGDVRGTGEQFAKQMQGMIRWIICQYYLGPDIRVHKLILAHLDVDHGSGSAKIQVERHFPDIKRRMPEYHQTR